MDAASGINFTGIASGLDTAKIIDAMLKVDQSRIDLMTRQRSSIDAQLSAIGTLRSKLSTLDDKLQALRFQNQILTRTTTTDTPSGQPAIVSATADSTATLGSFKVTVNQLATATRRFGAVGVGDETINTSGPLASAGLALTPTAGSFTVNGVAINVSNPASLDDFVNAINAAQGQTGVVASYVTNGSGNPVGIRIDNDASHSGQAIQLGSAADTSNFLTAVKLSTATQSGDTVQSTSTLGRLATTAPLSSARLATALSSSTGSFTINGVSFNYNASSDTIASMLAQINSSAANVTATYDSVANQITLISKGTGAQTISTSDVSGNFLQALGVTNGAGATETLGQNASYSIDTIAGGAPQSSTSNTISGVIPGVTLNLLQQSATPVTVTVSQDTSGPLAAMKDFVSAFNDALDFIRNNSVPSQDGSPGVFQGDSSVRFLADNLRMMATNRVNGLTGPYASLADLGITTGPVGSAVGTTNDLVIDESKFTQALSSNPQAAYDMLNSAVGGSNGVFTQLRTYLDNATLPGGVVDAMSNAATARETDLDQRITDSKQQLDRRRQQLQAQFARMEAALAEIQSQGQRLQAQLGGLQQTSSGQPGTSPGG